MGMAAIWGEMVEGGIPVAAREEGAVREFWAGEVRVAVAMEAVAMAAEVREDMEETVAAGAREVAREVAAGKLHCRSSCGPANSSGLKCIRIGQLLDCSTQDPKASNKGWDTEAEARQ